MEIAQRLVHSEACGRVNLIGEHTDYNGGFVFPTTIPQKTRVTLTAKETLQVRARSESLDPKIAAGEYRLGEEKRRHDWIDYIQGLTYVLRQENFAISGFELEVESEVPIGAGLSSSAALQISVLRALRAAFALKISDIQMARFGQRSENDFVGVRVGIMDQFAISLAAPGEAILIDTRELNYLRLPLPQDLFDLVVLDSGISHHHAGNEYNQRRLECETVCQAMGVAQLRNLYISDLPKIAAKVSPELFRRSRHVITENIRVLRFVQALRNRRIHEMGRLLNRTHSSLRDDYEVSTPEVDAIVLRAQTDPNVFGARITGGGFGGCILVLAHLGKAKTCAERILNGHRQAFPNSQAAFLLG